MINLFSVVHNQIDSSKTPTGLPEVAANETQLKNILATVFGVIAAVAVITIIVAAINFASAGGDADKLSKSKTTIIYALVGLVVAMSAEVIVLTVLGKL